MTAAMKLKALLFGRKAITNLDRNIKKQRHHFADKGPSSQSYGFSGSHECESWTIKKAEHWRIDVFESVVLEETLESPLDCKEMEPVHPKGSQSWKFIGRTDAETEDPVLSSPDSKSRLVGKDPDAGKDWRQEEKGTTEEEALEMSLSKFQKMVKDREPGMLQSMGSQTVEQQRLLQGSLVYIYTDIQLLFLVLAPQ